MAMSNILLKEVTIGLFFLFLMMALAYHITSPKVSPRNSNFCSNVTVQSLARSPLS